MLAALQLTLTALTPVTLFVLLVLLYFVLVTLLQKMGYTLRLKTKEGQQILNLISTDNVGILKEKIAELSQISANRLSILSGFPPKQLDFSDLTKPIEQIGIKNGDTLIVNEKHADDMTDPPAATNTVDADSLLAQRLADEEMEITVDGILLKQVVPSDNSCLFTSIGRIFFFY